MNQPVRLAVIGGVFLGALIGWAAAEYPGAGVGVVLGLATLTLPWRSLPLRVWAALYLNRNRPIELEPPVTVANDRSGGGVRFQQGVAVAAIQLSGKAHRPTLLIGSMVTETTNTVDICELLPHLHQSLGLTIESISVVSFGARCRTTGDYSRLYDTLIGSSPYAGQRETWLVIRMCAMGNGDALARRATAGTAVLAVAQRIAAELKCTGMRARVATATDIVELERHLGRTALEKNNRRWHAARGDSGWLTTYAYSPADITTHGLAQAWSLRTDAVIQNVTLFPDGRAMATLTVASALPPSASPSVLLSTLPGQQAQGVVANLCGPRPRLRGIGRGRLANSLLVPIGPSGVLLGKIANGNRLLLQLSDSGGHSRIHIAGDDALAKRILIRTAAAGERITVHSTDVRRWDSVRMPHIAVTDQQRPVSGSTVSVVDGTVAPTPRPSTVISVGPDSGARGAEAEIVIAQTGPVGVTVTAAGQVHAVEIELFRAENRYLSSPEYELMAD